MLALFFGEFQENALALGILEALAVSLEEAMRPALAADADAVRLVICVICVSLALTFN